jgi:hypothetical protein
MLRVVKTTNNKPADNEDILYVFDDRHANVHLAFKNRANFLHGNSGRVFETPESTCFFAHASIEHQIVDLLSFLSPLSFSLCLKWQKRKSIQKFVITKI